MYSGNTYKGGQTLYLLYVSTGILHSYSSVSAASAFQPRVQIQR